MIETNANLEESRSARSNEHNHDNESNLFGLFGILRQRWLSIAITFATIVTATGILTWLQIPIYNSKGQILISNTNDVSKLPGVVDQPSLPPISNQSNSIETEIQILRSIPILQTVIQRLDLRDKDDNPLKVKDFRAKMSSVSIEGTKILEVGYKDSNPQTAADVVNALMQFYLKNDVEVHRSRTRAARQFMNQQIPQAKRQVAQAEENFRRFKEKNRIVALSGEADVAVRGLAELKASIVETESKLLAAQERSRQLQAKLGGINSKQAIAIGKISESPTIQTTLQASKNLEDQLAIARTTYQPNHPEIANLEQQLDALNRTLQARIQTAAGDNNNLGRGNLELGQTIGLELVTALVKADIEANSIREQLSSLKKEYQAFLSRSDALPALEQKQSELMRDLKAARQRYETLLANYQKSQLAEQQNLGNARIINMAQAAETPISPNTALNLMLGGVLGVVGGVGVALLLHKRDIRLRTVADIRAVFPYPLLGSIPLFSATNKGIGDRLASRDQGLYVRNAPKSLLSETYRTINTNLRFSCSENVQVMVISSSLPGEGKSTTLANLALAMSELGLNVLLLDADLRQPAQHQIWAIPNRVGLCDVLAESSLSKGLPFIEAQPNLHIMPAGSSPANSTALLSSEKMKGLIDNLRAEYDYILIDAPPLTVVSDAVILGAIADGFILVGRPDILSWPAAQTAKEALVKSKQDVLGLIVNGVKIKNEPYRHYYCDTYYKNEYYADD